MKYIKLETGSRLTVDQFENNTNKSYPYYQDGKKYALCPACGSSVQIIGGINNLTQNKERKMYAAHTRSKVIGLNYDEEAKLNCLNYEGNANNWQRIFDARADVNENQEALEFINEHINEIAQEVERIIGFKCKYANRTSKLFDELYQSFINNGGLRILPNQFVPEYIPRLIVLRAGVVSCWGAIPLEKIRNQITNNEILKDSIDEGQFKPKIDVKLVGILDNDANPTQLIIKLVIEDEELVLKHISARYKD